MHLVYSNSTFESFTENPHISSQISNVLYMDQMFIIYILICILLILISVIVYLSKRYSQQMMQSSDNITNRRSNPEVRNKSNIYDLPPLLDVTSVNEETPIVKRPINERIENLEFDPRFEIDQAKLEISEDKLGSGFFGEVCYGLLSMRTSNTETDTLQKLSVAVKQSNDPTQENQEKMIEDETKLMCAIGRNPNILAIIGAVTANSGSARNLLIVEFVECGDLLKFLEEKKSIFKDELVYEKNGYLLPKSIRRKTYMFNENEDDVIEESLDSLCTSDLLSFSYQIAEGMEYLASIPCVHRDLALRNVLLNKNKTIRIADFGLARKYQVDGYYRITKGVGTPMPARWMAPEVMREGKCTEKSDVWSYGVSLYEMFSLGELPYSNVSNSDVFEHVVQGNQLPMPQYCHPKMYDRMKQFWNFDATFRPSFSKCVEFFEEHLSVSATNLLEQIQKTLKSEAERQSKLEDWIRRD